MQGEEDKFKEECGIFGIFAPQKDVACLTYYGLIRKVLGADSIHYLSYNGLLRALSGQLCTGCFTGIYPTEITVPKESA